jgi:hypothetical protein
MDGAWQSSTISAGFSRPLIKGLRAGPVSDGATHSNPGAIHRAVGRGQQSAVPSAFRTGISGMARDAR